MNLVIFTLAVIVGLMLAEARVSRRHEAGLRAIGAIEPSGDVYPLMAILYPLAFLVMGLEGAWRAASADADALSRTASAAPSWYAAGLLMFVAAKALKYWAIGSLGERWSFRVFVVPGAPLVTDGPYRYVSHPNYLGVVGELVGTAMMMEAWVSGPVMLAAFGAVLWARIRFETRVLASLVRRT